MSAESVATILCTSKQTRFHIDTPNYREASGSLDLFLSQCADMRQLDIEGVNITVASASPRPNDSTSKARSKTKADGIEILSNAKLRLKEGQRYALVGRNGTGKSSKPALTSPGYSARHRHSHLTR